MGSDDIYDRYTSLIEKDCQDILLSKDIRNLSCDELDCLVDQITNMLIKNDKNLPRARYAKHIRPFWNPRLNDLKRVKVRCYNEWKADGCPRSNLSRSWTAHKDAKRNFRREIKKVQRNFEKDEINRLLKTADCDINKFWRTIKKHRNGDQAKTCAVRNPAGKVVYETEEIIPVWKNHFSSLCTPNFDAEYDQEHFRNVTESVKGGRFR